MNRVWILRYVLEQIQLEAESKAPLETGGILIGYCSTDDQVVVTGMVGPGPKAKHKKWTYRPDYSFHREEMSKIFHESDGTHTYLGDWHSHPATSASLSFIDKRALRNIARFPGNYVGTPIMLIIGGLNNNKVSEWTPSVWRVSPLRHNFFWPRWEYTALQITVFDQLPD